MLLCPYPKPSYEHPPYPQHRVPAVQTTEGNPVLFFLLLPSFFSICSPYQYLHLTDEEHGTQRTQVTVQGYTANIHHLGLEPSVASEIFPLSHHVTPPRW